VCSNELKETTDGQIRMNASVGLASVRASNCKATNTRRKTHLHPVPLMHDQCLLAYSFSVPAGRSSISTGHEAGECWGTESKPRTGRHLRDIRIAVESHQALVNRVRHRGENRDAVSSASRVGQRYFM
jgi:hypothetical protein